jgi:hypothetical protein
MCIYILLIIFNKTSPNMLIINKLININYSKYLLNLFMFPQIFTCEDERDILTVANS